MKINSHVAGHVDRAFLVATIANSYEWMCLRLTCTQLVPRPIPSFSMLHAHSQLFNATCNIEKLVLGLVTRGSLIPRLSRVLHGMLKKAWAWAT